MASSPTPDFRPLAIHCLRSRYDPQAAQAARALLSDPLFDWPDFTQFVHQERISPLLHSLMSSQDYLPLAFVRSIQKAYLENAWINAQRLEELERLLPVFEAAQIPVVLLKGAALMISQYEKMALRPMGDMDLLVRSEDFDRAKQILCAEGYTPEVATTTWLSSDLVMEVHFQKVGRASSLIDLHASLFTPPIYLSSEQIDWFWKHKLTIEKKGLRISILNPEAQMIHLCAHLLYHSIFHQDGELLRLNDIDQLIQTNKVNWEEVLCAGKSFDLLIPLQKVLQELATNWNSPIPASVIDQLSQMQPSWQETYNYKVNTSIDRNYARVLFARIMSFPDWSSRMRYAWGIVFPPSQYIKDRYHVRSQFLLPAYYLYRLGERVYQRTSKLRV